MLHVFKPGQLVIYINGETAQIGIIKRLSDDGAFVWYHEGETAAKTPYRFLRPLLNAHTIKGTTLGGAAAIEEGR